MNKYKIMWEVSKYAFIEAENEEEALNKFHEETPDDFEDEIVSRFEVIPLRNDAIIK